MAPEQTTIYRQGTASTGTPRIFDLDINDFKIEYVRRGLAEGSCTFRFEGEHGWAEVFAKRRTDGWATAFRFDGDGWREKQGISEAAIEDELTSLVLEVRSVFISDDDNS